MKTILIIARHGNTFRSGEIPTRVGARTDLPLVEEERGRAIGKYLKENNLVPGIIYTSPLLRTKRTAQLAAEEMGLDSCSITELGDFTEIDYGVDENKTEEDVMLRLGNGNTDVGKKIIERWNSDAIVPDGWNADPQQIIETWGNFAAKLVSEKDKCNVVLLVTSNGIIRFAPYLTGDFKKFTVEHDIKVATGGICIFEKEDGDAFWKCAAWNLKPYKLY